MSKGDWNHLGTAEKKIVAYLAMSPNEKITDMAKGMGYDYHNTVAKAVKNLVKKRLVVVSGSYQSEKGRKVKLYGLTPDGVEYSLQLDIDYLKLFENYPYVNGISDLVAIFRILDEEVGGAWVKRRTIIIKKISRAWSALYHAGFTRKRDRVLGVGGIMASLYKDMKVSKKQLKRINRRMIEETSVKDIAAELLK